MIFLDEATSELGMYSQNLIKTIKFSPEVMLELYLRILHKKLGGNFKIRRTLKTRRTHVTLFLLCKMTWTCHLLFLFNFEI